MCQELLFRLAGVGAWQVRLTVVLLGAATLLLTWRLGRRLGGPALGVLAAWLLVGLRVAIEPQASGVPLLDLARIVRYDIAVPPLVLLALLCFRCARRRRPAYAPPAGRRAGRARAAGACLRRRGAGAAGRAAALAPGGGAAPAGAGRARGWRYCWRRRWARPGWASAEPGACGSGQRLPGLHYACSGTHPTRCAGAGAASVLVWAVCAGLRLPLGSAANLPGEAGASTPQVRCRSSRRWRRSRPSMCWSTLTWRRQCCPASPPRRWLIRLGLATGATSIGTVAGGRAYRSTIVTMGCWIFFRVKASE